jgi:hypothetical protein
MANAAEIRPLELALARAVKAATAAQQALDAARSRLSLRPAPRSFISAAEVERIERNHRSIVTAVIAGMGRNPADCFAYLGTPTNRRAFAAWAATCRAADALLCAGRAPEEAAAAATAAAITRAAAVARGELVELPADPTARGILRAGRRRRAEPPEDKAT